MFCASRLVTNPLDVTHGDADSLRQRIELQQRIMSAVCLGYFQIAPFAERIPIKSMIALHQRGVLQPAEAEDFQAEPLNHQKTLLKLILTQKWPHRRYTAQAKGDKRS
jgi:hypothetical protein